MPDVIKRIAQLGPRFGGEGGGPDWSPAAWAPGRGGRPEPVSPAGLLQELAASWPGQLQGFKFPRLVLGTAGAGEVSGRSSAW